MVPYLRAANVKNGYLDLSDVKEMNFTPREQDLFGLRPGDVLMTEGSGSLSTVGASAVWHGDLDGVVCFQNTLLRLRPRAGTEGRFLAWWIRHAQADGLLASVATGANIHHLSAERVRALPTEFPALDRQRAIAEYLDKETARLDALIARKQRLMKLLEERLEEEVAYELSRWPAIPIKRVVSFREGPGIMAADFREEGTPLVRVAGVGGEWVTLQGCNYLDPSSVAARWARFRMRRGDYLISASATMGIVSRVGEEAEGAIPYTGLIIVRPLQAIDMEYVRAFLSSRMFMRQIDQLKTGTAIQHFGPTHLDRVRIPVAPAVDQRRIGERLCTIRQSTQRCISRLQYQTSLLNEKRQAVITAAVTREQGAMEAAL